jgi:hypothetical protein
VNGSKILSKLLLGMPNPVSITSMISREADSFQPGRDLHAADFRKFDGVADQV